MDFHALRFQFQNYPQSKARHANANALSHNPIDSHDEDEDFGVEIQDEKKDASVAQV